MASEAVLGFDAREMWSPVDSSWSEGRRRRNLIRTDAARPLSVDGSVWLLALDAAGETGVARETAFAMQTEIRRGRGDTWWLWNSLAELAEACQRWESCLPRPYWMIALTVVNELGFYEYMESTLPEERFLLPGVAAPAEVAPGWHPLGYDVADASALSALATGLFEPDSDEEIFAAFRARLNTHHLFDSPDSADAFRLIANERVPEHAPFLVYGVYRIEERG